MSRDPTITINEENVTILPDGRVFYTFTPQQNTNSVRLASDCLGNAKFSQIMIERGSKATDYVAPFVIEGDGVPTGIFKDLKAINLELTDTENSKLWSRIKLTTNGMLREYHKNNISTEIVEMADGIATRISDATGKKLALINNTIDGIRRDYEDADRQLSSTFQTGIEGLKATMRDERLGLQAEIASSARGLSQKYDDELRKIYAKITTTSDGTTEAYENKLDGLRAEFTRSNQGMRSEIESKISGLQSTQQATANQISQEIKNRQGAINRIQQDIDSYQRNIRDVTGNYNSLRETVDGYERKISNQDSTIQSNFTMLKGLIDQRVTRKDVESVISSSGDSIKLAIQKAGGINAKMSASEIVSAINLNGYGVRIAGQRIALDGDTTVNGTFTTKIAEAIKIRADQIIAGTIDAAKIRVINLNASSIVGLDASFIKAKIEHTITSLLEGKVIRARNGAMIIDLNNSGISFNSNAEIAFNSKNNALVRRKGTHTAFVHFNDVSSSSDQGVGSVYASIGVTSSGDGVNSMSSGRFAGLRAFRAARGTAHGAIIDQVEIYGDTLIFSDDFNISRGFKMRPEKMPKMVDLNDLYHSIKALWSCWLHANNAAWSWDGNTSRAIIGEYNSHGLNL